MWCGKGMGTAKELYNWKKLGDVEVSYSCKRYGLDFIDRYPISS